MKIEEKLSEILLKEACGIYTEIDAKKDFVISIINLFVIDNEEKKKAITMVEEAKIIAEQCLNNNNIKNY